VDRGGDAGYHRRVGRRNTRLAVIDLVVAIGCMVDTLLAQPFGDIQNGASVLTSIWAAGTGAGAASGETDLRAALSVLGSARVEVVVPAEPVPLPAHAGRPA